MRVDGPDVKTARADELPDGIVLQDGPVRGVKVHTVWHHDTTEKGYTRLLCVDRPPILIPSDQIVEYYENPFIGL